MSSRKQASKEIVLLVVLSLVVLALIVYGAAGVRGTDQYWYIADVARLVATDTLVTNNYFPGVMLRTSVMPDVNYIMHNSPMLYIVGFFSPPGHEYATWIAVNTIFHYLIALCIYLSCRKLVDLRIACLVTALYLISPIAIWQTINPLLEVYFGAIVAILVTCFYYRANSVATFLLFGLLLLGVVSHPIFIVPSFLWIVFSLYEGSRNKLKRAILQSAAFLALLVFFMLNKNTWFPSSFQPDLKSIIASVVPGKSNMFWHYSDTLPEVNADLLMLKLVAGLKQQFIKPQFVLFYVFTNVAIFIAIYLTFFRIRRYFLVLLPLLLFGGQYIGIIILQQNHPRFQQIIAIVSFLLIALFLDDLKLVKRNHEIVFKYYLPVFCALLIFFNLFVVYKTRQESLFEAQHMSLLQDKLNEVIPVESKVVGFDIKPHNPFSSAVSPRNMLFIRTDMISAVSVDKALDSFKPDYTITKNQELSASLIEIARWKSELYGDLFIYKN